jgi:hypothetical protein
LKQTELLAQYTCLSANGGAGMLAATFAMTVARLNEWRINFKPHAATQTTPANALAHPRLSSSNYQLSTC